MVENICIFIESLKIDLFVGIYDSEKKAKQIVVIDIKLYFRHDDDLNSESVEHTLDYGKIVQKIEMIAQKQHWLLLENFAQALLTDFLSDEKVYHVYLRLSKPDIIANAKGVGIIIEKSR